MKQKNTYSSKSKIMRLLGFLAILLFFGSLISYFLMRSLIPWDFVDGLRCPFMSSRCGLSTKNFNYFYWTNKALKMQRMELCNNITGKEMYDLGGDSKWAAIEDCQNTLIIKTNNVSLCLSSEFRNQCLKGLAKRLHNEKLCEQISGVEDVTFQQRMIELCKDNVVNNKDNDLLVY